MKYYLSSYKFGDKVEKLKNILPQGGKIGHINNSKDWTTTSPDISNNHLKEEMEFMNNLGYINEHLDLKNYFGKENKLRDKIASLDGIWVCGGNAFVLRQAMKLSGFDNIFKELQKRDDFFYGGYSAGVCILSDSLKYIQFVDNPHHFPYKDITETIWEGLNLFNFGILPHYDSEHPESEEIGREVERCINNKWLFKTLRDGEVIIIE